MSRQDPMTDAQAKALDFHRIAREVFAPLYPVLAGHILRWYQEMTGSPLGAGTCLDVGSAAGHLGLALARQSHLDVTLVDISAEALALSADLLAGVGAPGPTRVATLVADVHHLPWSEPLFDLVVSRGSLWFWANKVQAFRELERVLKPGGLIVVGGGFGSAELRDRINQTMTAQEGDRWAAGQKQRRQGNSAADLEAVLAQTGFSYRLIDDDTGLWVLIPKPAPPAQI